MVVVAVNSRRFGSCLCHVIVVSVGSWSGVWPRYVGSFWRRTCFVKSTSSSRINWSAFSGDDSIKYSVTKNALGSSFGFMYALRLLISFFVKFG